jgi:hypothetical protein
LRTKLRVAVLIAFVGEPANVLLDLHLERRRDHAARAFAGERVERCPHPFLSRALPALRSSSAYLPRPARAGARVHITRGGGRHLLQLTRSTPSGDISDGACPSTTTCELALRREAVGRKNELAPLRWSKTVARDDVRARLDANRFRALTLDARD